MLKKIPNKIPPGFKPLLDTIKRKLMRRDFANRISWFDTITSDKKNKDLTNSRMEAFNKRSLI